MNKIICISNVLFQNLSFEWIFFFYDHNFLNDYYLVFKKKSQNNVFDKPEYYLELCYSHYIAHFLSLLYFSCKQYDNIKIYYVRFSKINPLTF